MLEASLRHSLSSAFLQVDYSIQRYAEDRGTYGEVYKGSMAYMKAWKHALEQLG